MEGAQAIRGEVGQGLEPEVSLERLVRRSGTDEDRPKRRAACRPHDLEGIGDDDRPPSLIGEVPRRSRDGLLPGRREARRQVLGAEDGAK